MDIGLLYQEYERSAGSQSSGAQQQQQQRQQASTAQNALFRSISQAMPRLLAPCSPGSSSRLSSSLQLSASSDRPAGPRDAEGAESPQRQLQRHSQATASGIPTNQQTPSEPPPPPPPPQQPAVRRVHQSQCQNHRVSSPFFAAAQTSVQKAAPTSMAAPPAVRNNSSLKPPSPTAPSSSAPPAQRQRSQPPPVSCSDLVHTFMLRDCPSLREILFDPDDRKMKSVSQRYGCYISVFEKARRVGHLLHKVVVRAPSEKALRMCINALDNGLNWDLASQLSRTNKKAASLVSSMAK